MKASTNLFLSLGALIGCALLFTACPSSGTAPPGGVTCGAGLSTCDNMCVNTANDPHFCGSCTNACGSGQFCDNGSCSTSCSALTTQCGASCVNTSTDPTHCGNCNTTCRSDQVCSGGACGCPAGQGLCNGVCAATCGTTGTGGRGTTGTGGTGTTGSGGSGTSGSGGRAAGTGGTGTTGTGGTGTTGTGGAGGTVVAGAPAGWWTSGTWHGCSWTGIDVVANSTTTNNPRDFLTKAANTPYCVSGTVNATYESVALLGFNLNETPNGNANQCAYKPADPTAVGPPGVTLTGTGLAVSYNRLTGSNIRVQIQGPNGGMTGPTGENDRWCFTITQVQGPIFAPFNQFNTHCWDGSGTNYAGQPISAISFLVPGLPVPSPFSYCIGGFATGSAVSAAPAYTPNPYPALTGTIGGPGVTDLDFQRVKVSTHGAGGKSYIVQNNNWGTPTGTDQTIQYTDNSFKIISTTGNVTGAGVPASFPSIYIGANGDTQRGVFSTTSDDGLPKQISAIGTANTMFAYTPPNGAVPNGDYNATYDVWLSSAAPTSAYSDAISGFLMVWLYQPAGRSPIGSMVGTATIGGRTWNVWAGPRNSGTNPNRPVISYVSQTPLTSLSFDLKPFLADAAVNTAIPSQFREPSSWFVTDIFAGFEIWTGSSATNLQATAFSATVQ